MGAEEGAGVLHAQVALDIDSKRSPSGASAATAAPISSASDAREPVLVEAGEPEGQRADHEAADQALDRLVRERCAGRAGARPNMRPADVGAGVGDEGARPGRRRAGRRRDRAGRAAAPRATSGMPIQRTPSSVTAIDERDMPVAPAARRRTKAKRNGKDATRTSSIGRWSPKWAASDQRRPRRASRRSRIGRTGASIEKSSRRQTTPIAIIGDREDAAAARR